MKVSEVTDDHFYRDKKVGKRNPEQFFNNAVIWHELLHSNPK